MTVEIPDYDELDSSDIDIAKHLLLTKFREKNPKFTREGKQKLLTIATARDVILAIGKREKKNHFLDMAIINATMSGMPDGEDVQEIWIPRSELNLLPKNEAETIATAAFAWRKHVLEEDYLGAIQDGGLLEIQEKIEALESGYRRRMQYIANLALKKA